MGYFLKSDNLTSQETSEFFNGFCRNDPAGWFRPADPAVNRLSTIYTNQLVNFTAASRFGKRKKNPRKTIFC